MKEKQTAGMKRCEVYYQGKGSSLSACMYFETGLYQILQAILGLRILLPASASCAGVQTCTTMPDSEKKSFLVKKNVFNEANWAVDVRHGMRPTNVTKAIKTAVEHLAGQKVTPGSLHTEYKTRNGSYLRCSTNNNTQIHSFRNWYMFNIEFFGKNTGIKTDFQPIFTEG